MKTKLFVTILSGVVVIIIGTLAWIKLNPQTDKYKKPISTDSTQKTEPIVVDITPTPNPTESWEVLNNLGYKFKYPTEAKGESREEESLVVHMGQKQIDSGRTQTELFDGYSFRVGEIINDKNLTLEQLAKGERENTQNNCNSEDGKVSEVKIFKVDGKNGFQYSALSCYIDYTETIVENAGKFYRISQSYVGEPTDQEDYKKTTEQILGTFEFLDSAIDLNL